MQLCGKKKNPIVNKDDELKVQKEITSIKDCPVSEPNPATEPGNSDFTNAMTFLNSLHHIIRTLAENPHFEPLHQSVPAHQSIQNPVLELQNPPINNNHQDQPHYANLKNITENQASNKPISKNSKGSKKRK